MTRARIATAWLGGCSGCHMSLLDMDEWLFELAQVADIVYSPIADVKIFPEDVDATLVEGAIANEDNLELALEIRAKSRLVISFGDCAVTGNVTAMRNPLGDPQQILQSVYVDAPDRDGQIPVEPGIVPPLLPQVLPVHKAIRVDAFLPGCPPPADRIQAALEALLEGALPPNRGEAIRFG
ncbi:MAG: oxidoreductase [bacterium]|nr:oxidoreductase [bacterium]MCP4964445.1 oxidoreductase [bacterium]